MDIDATASVLEVAVAVDSSAPLSQHRYMLTQVGNQQLVFPTNWVAEIMLIERSQILKLPFYDRLLMGLIHYNGSIVPLLSARHLLQQALSQDGHSKSLKETLSVMRLRSTVDGLAGVGIVVDQVMGSLAPAQITEQRLFQPSDIPDHLWQPRW